MQSFARFSVLAGFFGVLAIWGTGCAVSESSVVSRSIRQSHQEEPSTTGVKTPGRVRLASSQVAQVQQKDDQPTTKSADQPRSNRKASANSAPPADASGDPADVSSNGNEPIGEPDDSDQSDAQRQNADKSGTESQTPRSYTAPSASVRAQLATSTIRRASALKTDVIQGAEASQNSLISPESAIGASGLSASLPTARGFIRSSNGLVDTNQALFPSAAPTNLFTAVANPSSGPDGACAQLAQAGLANRTAFCRAHTKR